MSEMLRKRVPSSTRSRDDAPLRWGIFMVVAAVLVVGLAPLAATAGWQHFTRDDGLSNNRVWSVLADRSGTIWFGTDSSFSRYDGVTWRGPPYGFLSGRTQVIFEDSSGNIWLGSHAWVIRYDGQRWYIFTSDDGLGGGTIRDIAESPTGEIWVATSGGGVSCYDGSTWTTFTSEDGLGSDYFYSICVDPWGIVWAGKQGWICRYNGSYWRTIEVEGPWEGQILSLAVDRDGNLWAGTYYGGARMYDHKDWHVYTTADGLAGNQVESVDIDSDGNVWFGTASGISRYDGATWTTYRAPDGPVSNSVNAVCIDGSGCLWAGTWEGASRYDGVHWRSYDEGDGLVADETVCAFADSAGRIWIGTVFGVGCFEGGAWTSYTTEDGLASDIVTCILEDGNGDYWFATADSGVTRWDGSTWTTYTTAHGLVDDRVNALAEDSEGNLWFGTSGGVTRYDGTLSEWHSWTTAQGLSCNVVTDIVQDASGAMWFSTSGGGVDRFEDGDWTNYTAGDGLAGDIVHGILEDSSGDLWFATSSGVSRFDGATWTTYTTADGLSGNDVRDILEDDVGALWFTMWGGGVSRYEGLTWTRFSTIDGLSDNSVRAVVEDAAGRLWFATWGGVTVHEPDRVAPHAVVWPEPPRVTGSPAISMTCVAAFGETQGTQFSHSLDGGAWTGWTPAGLYTATGLSDGQHEFRVIARDDAGNVGTAPAVFAFEVDATPPSPLLASPAFGAAVRDSIEIEGTADDARFAGYSVEARPQGGAQWLELVASSTPVVDGSLGGWRTDAVPDGPYDLRLSVADTLGLVGTVTVQVVVDNESPWAWETTPALVSAASGGEVYTTDGAAHLYFSPRSLSGDALVTIEAADTESVPDTLGNGALLAFPGFDVGWESVVAWEAVEIEKPPVLELGLPALDVRGSGDVLALYVLPDGEDWRRIGGTVTDGGERIAASIDREGVYAVYSDSGGEDVGEGLSALTFTPRVFSPAGAFARDEVSIGFRLGRAGRATVRVYNRAGRLVREVASGVALNAGSNLVPWDGRDDAGETVPDGLYVVVVEALGESRTRTLAVVR